jgi:hypothetical protein
MNGAPFPAASPAAEIPLPVVVTDDHRRFARKACKLPAQLTVVEAWDPEFGEKRQFNVIARNISRNGICFIFFRQFYPDDRITLEFGDLVRHYRVARCRRVAANCFEVGAMLMGG